MSSSKNTEGEVSKEKIEKNLAYGGQALIEGIMMRGQNGYSYVIKKPDGSFHKEKKVHKSLAKRYKILGLPFIRGVAGFIENMILGLSIINKSAEIAMPEEIDKSGKKKETSNVALFFTFLLAMVFAMGLFVVLPYFTASIFKIKHNEEPFMYNLIAGIIRMVFFFVYLLLISLMKDTKRLFGYHGAEHKTIHTYEANKELTIDNVSKSSRLHPRCGTSFIFIVFLITLLVFPFINKLFIDQQWYQSLSSLDKLGGIIQKLIIILSHIVIGMPIVSSISYEILKLSGKFYKNFLIKIFVSPGLFFQLFTTREPEDNMIKVGILSLNLLLGVESLDTPRTVNDDVFPVKKSEIIAATILTAPAIVANMIFDSKNFYNYEKD
ncbi:MAG TPA: DUF1385 domain-containing protein [Spirochaetota bacterium]|nr:DUF1385 domain-containing protein [Spirochaetota bacterium]HOS31868.1 DUF1385 domain-containing protein [Spirochaetota bacterium]HOS54455.1 DUF1385 domain-containing protein [Spirochaetota bacterium]HPK62265.1 DUF1385 domain-containing protein [Spirochaetota bacterium]HQF76948.1 DUF1385 domain-containing protein [Spirochaetota bacterium]